MESWDDAAAEKLFSGNVALDQPFEANAAAASTWPASGSVTRARTPRRAPESDTPAHCRWWVTGEHGSAQVEIKLTPERDPRVQSFTLAVPPAPGSPLAAALAGSSTCSGTGRRPGRSRCPPRRRWRSR